jgi:hypothetical protein
MKTTKSLKTVAFALGLAAMGLTAGNLNAQTGGGLFGRGEEGGLFGRIAESLTDASNESLMRPSGGNSFDITTGLFGGNGGDAGGNYGINIGTFGQDPPEETTPLGSGLFIMAAAGAAYAFSRKRKNQENN